MEEDRNESPIPPVPARLGEAIPQRMRALLDCPPVPLEVAAEHGWNPEDRSFNVELKEEDVLVMRRRPVAQSTDCIRSKTGYSSGLHLFEITWPVRQRGTHAVVGVATLASPLHAGGYQSLVGSSGESWGWDLGRKKAFHGGEAVPFPPSISHHHQWTVPDTFHMVLDMDRGCLSFLASGELLGASHTGLPRGQDLYPVVSTVWGHCEVKLKYLGSDMENSPPSLQELVRGVIRGAVSGGGHVASSSIEGLGLPKLLQNFLLYNC
jgi:SPRY domain-containing SOCS box protein 1/4